MEANMLNTLGAWSTFWRSDVFFARQARGIWLSFSRANKLWGVGSSFKYIQLYPITLHYTPLRYIYHYIYTTLRYTIQLQLHLHYITLHYLSYTNTAPHFIRLPYNRLIIFTTPSHMQLQPPSRIAHTTTPFSLHYQRNYRCYTTLHPAVSGHHFNHYNLSKKHRSNHLSRPSVDSLCGSAIHEQEPSSEFIWSVRSRCFCWFGLENDRGRLKNDTPHLIRVYWKTIGDVLTYPGRHTTTII